MTMDWPKAPTGSSTQARHNVATLLKEKTWRFQQKWRRGLPHWIGSVSAAAVMERVRPLCGIGRSKTLRLRTVETRQNWIRTQSRFAYPSFESCCRYPRRLSFSAPNDPLSRFCFMIRILNCLRLQQRTEAIHFNIHCRVFQRRYDSSAVRQSSQWYIQPR